jgi:hypothetical protein
VLTLTGVGVLGRHLKFAWSGKNDDRSVPRNDATARVIAAPRCVRISLGQIRVVKAKKE